jgi:glycerol kinase
MTPPSAPLVLAVDSGSSSLRTVIAELPDRILADARESVPWLHPQTGWVELDPCALWESVRSTIGRALASAGVSDADLSAVAITSHRETVVMWDRRTGLPVHNAVVWISKQTDDIVRGWDASGLGDEFAPRTGLRNDSFFSAGKVAWLLDNVPDARRRAEAGELVVGTIDCWLLWNLTGGEVHATDPSCASRTALFNLEQGAWDEELCSMLGIPVGILPEVRPSDGDFGRVRGDLLPSRPPVRGVVADQQASMFGQACFEEGAVKHTLGTAGVLTVTTGSHPRAFPGLTSSVAWQVQGTTVYEAEGVVFHSGQTLHLMRDKWRLPVDGPDVDRLASSVPDSGGVYLVPAFGGMAAPWWNRDARAAVMGITLDTTLEHLVRAAVEAMAFQVVDIVEAIRDSGVHVERMKVDGGGASSELLCQSIADLARVEVLRPRELERTSLGAALIAGVGAGLVAGIDEVASSWIAAETFVPSMSLATRDALYGGWRDALATTLTGTPDRKDAT